MKTELDIKTARSSQMTKHYITANFADNDSECHDIIKYLKEENATIVSHYIFGNRKHYDNVIAEIKKEVGEITWAIMWLDGDQCDCDCLTGNQIVAVSGVDVKPIVFNDEIVGVTYEDDDAEYCELSNLHSKDSINSVFDNSRLAFEKMADILKIVNMDFSNVIRMWNYLDNLLTWYDEFNVMRTAFFNEHNVFDNIIPAGTGIGAGNSNNTPYVGAVLAVKPKKETIKFFPVASPLQCAAVDYKSSFSRAVELDLTDYRYLSISGTASIEPGGKTIHIDDVPKQIELTMQVVDAILKSRNMDWKDTVKAITYFADINDVHLFEKYLTDNNYPDFPVAISHADVCRDDLLFELELDAISAK